MIITDADKRTEFFKALKEKGKVVAVSGYFDPPTPTHLVYFQAAGKLGDLLVVLLNNDDQLLMKRKGTKLEGRIRYPLADRALILNELRTVDYVVVSIDTTGGIYETLKMVKPHIFAKGGDRNPTNLPEEEIQTCREIGCEIVCGVGGGRSEKSHSSSWYDWES
jgi:D-beta-D-heptose 7-phosphate kinase/D-beta-D-heptose 1-phosphate adenosyltransferase